MRKNRKLIIICLFCLLFLNGCNRQMIDLDYNYDKAVCNYNEDKIVLKIDKWRDYEDGEQIQIKSGNKTYLLSMYNCYLVDE